MRGFRSLVGLALLVLAACSSPDVTDPAASEGGKLPSIAPSTTSGCTVSPDTAAIRSDIQDLMAVLTPNNSAAESKWNTILGYLDDGNYTAAQDELNTLIGFINLKFGQASGTTQAAWLVFKNALIDDLTCYVELNSFDLNPDDPEPKVFTDNEGGLGNAGVYFPAGFVPKGFNVEVTIPTTPPLLTSLDQYPSFINITLKDADGKEPDYNTVQFTGEAFVAVCFPAGLAQQVYDRLLLGHQGRAGFELLEKRAVPQELADALECGVDLTTQTTTLGRVMRKVADLVLPAKLNAMYFASYGGVGGSPEEFSPFGAVDPGLLGGGAGGSPEEFAPGMMPSASGPMTSTVSGGGTIVTGKADEDPVTLEAQLPKVRVTTPGTYVSGVLVKNGIDGVVVTFELFAPDGDILNETPPITGPDSDAALCASDVVTRLDGTKYLTRVTANGGYASVDCLNFGAKLGYKNLRATFDPSSVSPLACILNTDGACDTANARTSFLVETIPGLAAHLDVVSKPSGGQVGEKLGDIVLKVTDGSAARNPIQGSKVTISTAPLATGGTLGCYGGGTGCLADQTTGTNGQVTFSNLKITGAVAGKPQTLTFSTAGVANTTVSVTLDPGLPATLAVSPGATTATAVYPNGGDLSDDLIATVKDGWGNKILGALVSVSAPTHTLNGTTTDVGTVVTATDDTVATFADLKLGGGAGAVVLTFTSAGVAANATTTVTLSPGPAATLAVSPGTTTATALYPNGGDLGNTLVATVKDGWGNKIHGAKVSVSAPASTHTLNGTKTDVPTAVTAAFDTVAAFGDLKLGGTAGSAIPLTFTSAGTANATVTVNLSAGPVENLSVTPAATTSTLDATIPTLTATVKDGWLNNLSVNVGVSAPVGVTLTGTLNRTASAGVAQFNNLVISATNFETVPLTFVAGAKSQVVDVAFNLTIAACTVSGSQKKTNLGPYSSASGSYLGRLTTKAVRGGSIRSAELAMSVTGQSSGTGGYPTTIRAYRVTGAGAKGEPIASGNPFNGTGSTDNTLRIPGDNGTPALIKFNLTAEPGKTVLAGDVILFEVEVFAASNRTFQVWYNTRTTAGSACANSKVLTGTITDYLNGTAIQGVTLNTRNFSY